MTLVDPKSPAGHWLADGLVDPEIMAVRAITAINKGLRTVSAEGEPHTGVDLVSIAAALRSSSRRALAPDAGTAEMERHLWASITLLQSLTGTWAVAAAHATHTDQLDLYARLTLKAQNQLRQTLATLADIRAPRRTTFIKQQNQAVNQQVLNSPVADQTGKIQDLAATQLLCEEISHERVDFGAAALAVRDDADLATVGTQYRATNARRESQDPP